MISHMNNHPIPVANNHPIPVAKKLRCSKMICDSLKLCLDEVKGRSNLKEGKEDQDGVQLAPVGLKVK